jgi:hypothetical protein
MVYIAIVPSPPQWALTWSVLSQSISADNPHIIHGRAVAVLRTCSGAVTNTDRSSWNYGTCDDFDPGHSTDQDLENISRLPIRSGCQLPLLFLLAFKAPSANLLDAHRRLAPAWLILFCGLGLVLNEC